MAILSTIYGLRLAHPWWLGACALLAPMLWMAWRNLAPLGPVRQALAIALRCLVVILLAAILSGPSITRRGDQLTLITVLDRSQSVPFPIQEAALKFLEQALAKKDPRALTAVVDVAEAASISKLPTADAAIKRRSLGLSGTQSRLSAGVEMALAIAPPHTAVRLLLVSDGNETAGNLRETARTAAANGIPIDVLPLHYSYDKEVVLSNLVAPVKARSGQTVPLRFVLKSTAAVRGRLMLTLNGKPVGLDPSSPDMSAPVELKAGTNVKTVSLPLTGRGLHEFKATFLPDDPAQDSLEPNNHASAITIVAGPGHVLVVDADGQAGQAIAKALKDAQIDVRHIVASDFPANLVELLDCDAVVLANTENSGFTQAQQELLCRYVTQMGGGLVMTGGPEAFGAGGWIGSSVAEILPVDMDPPQKKQLPKGALVLIMHACEMPDGNFWGKQVATAAVGALSRLDLAGVLSYRWQAGNGNWVHPLSEVGDKSKIRDAIKQMQMGDMPDFGASLQEAYDALVKSNAGAKHVIIISDGDPQMPSKELLDKCKKAGVTCTGVAIFPHSSADVQSLMAIAQATGGRFYNVKDPNTLPQIFIKEAQVVRRPLILEEKLVPIVSFSVNEIVRALEVFPTLDGQVLTGPKGGTAQLVLTTQNGDPLLAAGQAGLGRCVAFTSSADARWARGWLGWGGFGRFWEQAIRWAGKPAQSADCEVFADVDGRQVSVSVEAADPQGKAVQLSRLTAQVIGPDMTSSELALSQVGPGRYRGQFQAGQGGAYLLNLRYRKPGGGEGAAAGLMHTAISVPYAPEYRDLSDNASLLLEVAAMTGGRVIRADPKLAELFSPAGVKFPESATPLRQALLLIWLGVFIMDVAVRRIAIDMRAVLARLVAAVGRIRHGRRVDATLEALKIRKAQHVREMAKRSGSPAATARYQASEQAQRKAEQAADAAGAGLAPPAAAAAKPAPDSPGKPAAQPSSHLEQLLQAKRKAGQKPPPAAPNQQGPGGAKPPGDA